MKYEIMTSTSPKSSRCALAVAAATRRHLRQPYRFGTGRDLDFDSTVCNDHVVGWECAKALDDDPAQPSTNDLLLPQNVVLETEQALPLSLLLHLALDAGLDHRDTFHTICELQPLHTTVPTKTRTTAHNAAGYPTTRSSTCARSGQWRCSQQPCRARSCTYQLSTPSLHLPQSRLFLHHAVALSSLAAPVPRHTCAPTSAERQRKHADATPRRGRYHSPATALPRRT